MASKITRVSRSTEESDLISNLPDDVLCHILSFLDTVNSVRTRVLSTRWKHLFSLVPILDFCNRYDKDTGFADFISWVFNSYNVVGMDRFRFACYKNQFTNRLPSWISESVHRGVKRLDIHYSFYTSPTLLPCCIFTCKSLYVLKLHGHYTLDVPQNVCLPRLKTMSLVGISFEGTHSAGRLFRCCPVLEDLYFNFRCLGVTQVLYISVSTLRSLTIVHAYGKKFDLVLDVPNLENLVYTSGGMIRSFNTLQALKSLAKVCIRLYEYHREDYKALEKLVTAVYYIQDLNLRGFKFEAFQSSGGLFPIFCNLAHLELAQVSCCDLKWVLDLLDRTPLLQVLVVDNVGFSPNDYHGNDHLVRFPPAHVPTCMSLHLIKVAFNGFSMLENEFKMVEYILNNAKILDVLKIQLTGCRGNKEKQSETRNKLFNFSRYSTTCQLMLVEGMGET